MRKSCANTLFELGWVMWPLHQDSEPTNVNTVLLWFPLCREERGNQRNNHCLSLSFPTMHMQLTAKIPVLSVWGTQNIIMQSISHLRGVFILCLWRDGAEALGRIMLTWHFAIALIAGSFVLSNPVCSTQSELPCLSRCLLNTCGTGLKKADLVKAFEQVGCQCWNGVQPKLSCFC